MKANILIFLVLTLFLSSLYSVGITFMFAHEAFTNDGFNDYYEFDVMIASVEPTNLGTNQVYFTYNTDAFGEYFGDISTGEPNDNPNVTVTKGTALQGFLPTTTIDLYSGFRLAYNQSYKFGIQVDYIYENNPEYGYSLTDDFIDLIHIKILILDPSFSSGIAFDQTLMEGQEYLSDNNTPYSPVIAEDTFDNPLPVTLSTFSGVQDGDCVQLNWLTQSESNNWLWNVYRSSTSDLSSSSQHNGMPIWGAGTTSVPTQYSYQDDDIEALPILTYYYWLESVDHSGQSEVFGPISLNYFQSEENISAPELKKESLLTNYPNPFNPSTNIGIIVAEDTKADLIIYNSKGQLIDTIFKDKYLEKDLFESFFWDGKSNTGTELPNGVYFAKLTYRGQTKIHRMILLK